MAQIPFHGAVDGLESNLAPIVRAFPTWSLREADGLWCAAFVYYCCREAGFGIPYRPGECKTCHLAACLGWEEFALSDPRIEYHKGAEGYVPEAGDTRPYGDHSRETGAFVSCRGRKYQQRIRNHPAIHQRAYPGLYQNSGRISIQSRVIRSRFAALFSTSGFVKKKERRI